MVIEFSNNITHPCTKANPPQYSEEQTQEMVLQLMQKVGIDSEAIRRKEDGVLEIGQLPNLKLHSLMLRAEEMGLGIKYTKKTMIEIC